MPEYGRSSDGYTRHQQDKVCTAAEKLEQLISETHARRVAHCDSPAEEILEEHKLKVILDSWKNDYEQWMRPETLDKTWNMTWQQWHQHLRRAFRSYIFEFVGSYEMVFFFIVAPFQQRQPANLSLFRRTKQTHPASEHTLCAIETCRAVTHSHPHTSIFLSEH